MPDFEGKKDKILKVGAQWDRGIFLANKMQVIFA